MKVVERGFEVDFYKKWLCIFRVHLDLFEGVFIDFDFN